MKPRLLDLFCCGGGASRGYALAGFDVTGVDIDPQPGYPFAFVQADALEFVAAHGHEFDAIHASPPCQGYCAHVTSADSPHVATRGRNEPRLIDATRDALARTGRPWVIENVTGARDAMRVDLVLCGSMFGLPTPRHRLFESNVALALRFHPECRGIAKEFAAREGWEYRDMSVTGKGRRTGTADRWKRVLGIEPDAPMTQHQLSECIPPAFTQAIGADLMRAITPRGES